MANMRSLDGAAAPSLTWQPSLLGAGAGDTGAVGVGAGDAGAAGAAAAHDAPARPDASFTTLARVVLDDWCWLDLARGWLAGADTLFARLLADAPWRAREVPMYGRLLPEPRLTATWAGGLADPSLPPGVAEIAAALGDRYRVELPAVSAALYRDGRDSVAMHSDRVARELPHPLVALVSLGGPRHLLVRPKGGGPSRRIMLASGDLLVMGGACQERYEHGVPKVASAPPRISVQLRQRAEPDRAIAPRGP